MLHFETLPGLRLYILPLLLPLLILSACQDDPDPAGIDIIPQGDLIHALRFDSLHDSSDVRSDVYSHSVIPHASPTLGIGSAEGFEASTLIRWVYVPNNLAGGGRILSAFIRLHTQSYGIGDRAQALTIDAREINGFWSSFTFTADSLRTLDVSAIPSGSGSATLGDVDSMDIALDTALVRKWLDLVGQGRNSEIRGVLLQARSEGLLRAFNSAESAEPPTLFVVVEEQGSVDTLRGENLEDTWVVTGSTLTVAERLSIHPALAQRARLFFDVSSIPPACIINYASLQLHIDRTLSTKNFRGVDSLIVFENLDSLENSLYPTGIITRVDSNDPSVLIAEGLVLTRAVQQWVNMQGNSGLVLTAMLENSDLDRLVIYGADAPVALRPRLVVTYTSKP